MNTAIKAILAAIVILCSHKGILASAERPMITLVQGKITEQYFISPEHAAIVNHANEQLRLGWGICREIYTAANWPEEQKPYALFKANADGVCCPQGEARITAGGKLHPLRIIHTVVPDCRTEAPREEGAALLISAYENSLLIANDQKITTLAIPCSLSFSGDKEVATHAAITAVINFLQEHAEITEVRFVAHSRANYEFYKYHLELATAAEPIKLILNASGGAGEMLSFSVPPKQDLTPSDTSWSCIVQ